MRQYLLPKDKKYYKVNLHGHTNLSDGKATPEQAKEEYKKRGYAACAFTDHFVMPDVRHLTDDDFIAILGTELAVNEPNIAIYDYGKTYHINLIATHEKVEYSWDQYKPMEYSIEGINRTIALAKENGFMVAYNHPHWSLQWPTDYIGLKGLYGMEVFNTEAMELGDTLRDYLYMSDTETKLIPIASDDNHNRNGFEGVNKHCFGGWNMVACESLSYENIIKALQEGDGYASTGVTIEELYVEDKRLYIKCSPCSRITMYRGGRITWDREVSENDDLTEASFGIDVANKYLLVECVTKDGKKAITRAYFDFAK